MCSLAVQPVTAENCRSCLVVLQEFSFYFILRFNFFYLAGAPRFSKTPPGQITGFLGKETRLQCDFLGNPTPEVTWARSPPNPLPQGRSEVRKDGLYINNTEREDGGVYTCFARNDYGIKLHGTFLQIKSVGKHLWKFYYNGTNLKFAPIAFIESKTTTCSCDLK